MSVNELKTGLVLGGGGARGIAHIVVLEILDEMGIKIDEIAASSIGSIIGMGYAAGMSGKELRHYALHTFSDRNHVLTQLWGLRPATLQDWFNPKSYSLGQVDPKKALSLFTPIDELPDNLEDLTIPLKIVATDFCGWREAIFQQGRLQDLVAASIAIPMVFKPVEMNGRIMIDGNFSNPLPFDILKQELNRVIAVDVVGGPNFKGEGMPSGFETMVGANQILMQTIINEKLKTNNQMFLFDHQLMFLVC